MTDRVLTMLYQYLLSNQSLELNETFQIYLKVLSIEHSTFNASMKPQKKTAKKPRLQHVGGSKHAYAFKWAVDFPTSNSLLAQKCLLMCTILGLLQHLYYENKKANKQFLSLCRIQSTLSKHKNYATKMMIAQLEKLFSVTGLKQTGPYELKSTIVMLSHAYKCQFFVFDGLNNGKKLSLMYPKAYDDSLKPIFIYRPSLDQNHVLFIRNLTSYFSSNCFICLACGRQFKGKLKARCSHICKKRETCFACRRFFQTSKTYLNSMLEGSFCDKLTTCDPSFNCTICNCTIYSKKCLKGHKRFCRGRGYFGYKCSDCNRFTYCFNQTSEELQKSHNCADLKICKFCYKVKDADHLCPMKIEKCVEGHTRLAFFKIAFDKLTNKPLMALFYREEEFRGNFSRYSLFEPNLKCSNSFEKQFLSRQYFDPELKIPNQGFVACTNLKLKDDVKSSLKRLEESEESFSKHLATFLLSENSSNTTYICEDATGIILVFYIQIINY